jgi:tetratricopeptide (TPR) repeat protein
MVATAACEDRLDRGDSIDLENFIQEYPDIPKEVLLTELRQIFGDFSASANRLQSNRSGSESEKQAQNSYSHAERFSALELIGSGGMGEIYRGFDHEFQRAVAIKKIRRVHHDNPEARSRFKAEAEMTAGLEHPGIIPIYGKGVDAQGRDFYAMRLISGTGAGTLASSIREFHSQWTTSPPENRLSINRYSEQLRELVRRLIDIADTVGYVHSRGIVHRDLKPTNILIGPYGETLIADWGLARKLDASPLPRNTSQLDAFSKQVSEPRHHSDENSNHSNNATSTCNLSNSDVTSGVGTPGYRAPELSEGTQLELLRLSDVYSLGAILYCILNGSSPSEDTSSIASKRIVPSSDSLHAICRKAMASESAMRYQTTNALRADLLNWIAGEPVSANPEDWWERAVRWPNRNRSMAAALSGALVIAFFAGSLFLGYQSLQSKIFEKQSKQLQTALNASTDLLEQTRQAKLTSENALHLAEVKQEEADSQRSIAERRGTLAFNGLLKFQDLLVSRREVFESADLNTLHSEFSSQVQEVFQAIFTDAQQQTLIDPKDIVLFCDMTRRLAVLESSLKNFEQTDSMLDRTSAWMTETLKRDDLPKNTIQIIQLQISSLRSLQGALGIQVDHQSQAQKNLDDAIERLSTLLKDSDLAPELRKRATLELANAWSSLALHSSFFGTGEQAIDRQKIALEILGPPDASSYNDALARMQLHSNMSQIYEQLKETDSAITELQKASQGVEQAERLLDGSPDKSEPLGTKPIVEFFYTRSKIGRDQARLLIAKKDYAAAMEVLHQLAPKQAQALEIFPSDSRLIGSYRTIANTIQMIFLRTGQREKAIEFCERQIDFAKSFCQNKPKSNASIVFKITAFHSAGHAYEQLGSIELALQRYRQALEECEQGESEGSRISSIAYQKVELHMHQFHLQFSTTAWDDVEAHFRRAVKAAEELIVLPSRNGDELKQAQDQLRRGITAMRDSHREVDAAKWNSELRSRNLGP